MTDPSARTLRLLSLLQARRYWPGPDLAGRLGVSVRTLRRDVDRLRELGYPVSASRGVDGGYALAPGAALPPLVLDDDEAVALAVGLQAAAAGPVAGMAETSVRALAKLVQVMPARLRRRVEALRAMTVPAGWGPTSAHDAVDPAVLTAVALACRDTERTVFGYAPPGRERTERTVEPHRLVALGRRWYLVGWDLDRGDWRVFRLDRLDAPRGTGAVFGPRRFPAEDAAAYVRERIGSAWTRFVVEAVVAAPAGPVRERIGRWATVTDDGEGGCRVRVEADDLDWAALALGVTGAPFTVLSPPEMGPHLRALAARYTAAATS
ncbi:helix-turn-helix transcriptional regulator [Geodermatophilus maliterrae]|uniref:Helix-turn-helix transcriptional regulator n=1 Tax=Geodermatophilus maliterrae TaxID=3162531 RepID=A0ABV3XMM9_9ACTN